MRCESSAYVIGALVLVMAMSLCADDSIQINQWRVCAVSKGDFQNKLLPPGAEWFFVGYPANSFQVEKIFAHGGPFAYYVHFHVGALPDGAKPMLLINGLPEGSVVLLVGKPLAQTNQKKKGPDAFSVERWYRLPDGALRPGPGENNRLEIWAPFIRKSQDAVVAPVSVIVFDDPDVLAERERQRKLQYPYLHEVGDTEDPYVARHW